MTFILLKSSSELAYTSHLYLEALYMHPEVLYIGYAASSHEQIGDMITFAQFEEGGLVENNHNAAEYESIMASIINNIQTMTLMMEV